jgi:hypothetical protein
MRLSLERDRVRVVTLGTSGIATAARLLIVAPHVCNVTPLVDGRLKKGRAGRPLRDEDLSLSSGEFLKLEGYLSRVAAQMDRFKCELIGLLKECKLTSMPKPTVGCSRRSSVGTCVEVLVVNCKPGSDEAK